LVALIDNECDSVDDIVADTVVDEDTLPCERLTTLDIEREDNFVGVGVRTSDVVLEAVDEESLDSERLLLCDNDDDGDREVEMVVESDVCSDTDRLWDMESVIDQLSECDNEVEPEADAVIVLDAELEDDNVVDDDGEFDALPCEVIQELVPCGDKVPDGLIDLESPSTTTAVSSSTTSDTATRWQPDVIMF
jgi:hypothetical protein